MIPLSFAQQRLWFLQQLQGPSPLFNIPLMLQLRGALDVAALQAALADVIGRHESLRTVFEEVDGVGQQIVLAADAVALPFELREIAADALPAEQQRAAAHCFDLACEPPIRATLFRIATDDHVLLLLLHHIASDGGSLAPLIGDLAAAYAARTRRQAPAWEPLPLQYADYSLWQREWLAQESNPESDVASQIAYWKGALADLPEQLDLPADRPRPPQASHRGAAIEFRIAAPLHRRLRALAQDTQSSLFMLLHAALAALLSLHGAGEDVPIGTSVAGRHDEALDPMVGFLRQPAGVARGHFRQPRLPRTGPSRACRRPGGLQPSGATVRARGGCRQTGPLAGAASAVPGRAVAGQQPCRSVCLRRT